MSKALTLYDQIYDHIRLLKKRHRLAQRDFPAITIILSRRGFAAMCCDSTCPVKANQAPTVLHGYPMKIHPTQTERYIVRPTK
jgi:hypothetical protein